MNSHESACPTHASACCLVIREGGLVLAVWNEKHLCFGLPGGKREEIDMAAVAEPAIRGTARRELWEETHLTNAQFFWLYHGRYASLPKSDPIPREVHLYYVRSACGPIVPEKLECYFAWFRWDQLLVAAPAFRAFYEEALPDGIHHLKPTEFESRP